ncbi:MAG: ZIP family metal transporter [Lachnospiraceae bacterium]|nr:ZIP family metal transporter [Lachnospiraceae bacterium]
MIYGVLCTFLGTMFTLGITTLGALNVFLVKKKMECDLQCIFLGFAGGVMIAASVWSLLLPAIDRAEANNQISWLVVTLGFLFGVVLLLLLDRFIKVKEVKLEGIKTDKEMLILAITTHNIPEGMAIGLAFALAASNPGDANLFGGAVALTIGIGIQNYPEGAAVALPLLQDGMDKKKAFILGSLSAVVEPVFGILAAIFAQLLLPLMPMLLAFAAGTMIYVVVEELIPEAHMGERDNIGTLGFVVGFVIMMILDVALG